jgi:hypothetical protein
MTQSYETYSWMQNKIFCNCLYCLCLKLRSLYICICLQCSSDIKLACSALALDEASLPAKVQLPSGYKRVLIGRYIKHLIDSRRSGFRVLCWRHKKGFWIERFSQWWNRSKKVGCSLSDSTYPYSWPPRLLRGGRVSLKLLIVKKRHYYLREE